MLTWGLVDSPHWTPRIMSGDNASDLTCSFLTVVWTLVTVIGVFRLLGSCCFFHQTRLHNDWISGKMSRLLANKQLWLALGLICFSPGEISTCSSSLSPTSLQWKFRVNIIHTCVMKPPLQSVFKTTDLASLLLPRHVQVLWGAVHGRDRTICKRCRCIKSQY